MLSQENKTDLDFADKACRHCCIRINELTVYLGGKTILERVNLHIDCGEVLAVVGPNGAGKTTLLRAILGQVPYRGNMSSLIGGVEGKKPRIGYVPQKLQFDLDFPISVEDLVAATISHRPVWIGIDRQTLTKVKKVLDVFAAGNLAEKRIGELSGGELQRILLALAMTAEPELLLLDEPSTGVDAKGLALFYQLVRNLRKQHDISVILVTHDISGISHYVDRIVLLNRSIVAAGDPNEILTNEKLMHVFGPSLWNISSWPGLPSEKTL